MILIAKPGPIIQGSYRVFRGGGWVSGDLYCRLSPIRNGNDPTIQANILGFRVILRKRSK